MSIGSVPTGSRPGPGSVAERGVEETLNVVIAQRVRELRQRNGWTIGHLADVCGLSKGMLSKIENVQTAPSLGALSRLSEALGAPVTAFFRGMPEQHDVIFVKAGGGLTIDHRTPAAGHRHQGLGSIPAPHDTLEPMLVTLTERSEPFPLYQHSGTELIFMIAGRMEYYCGGSQYLLEPGDTVQFVGEVVHGPGELISLPVRYLAVKALGSRD